MQFNTAYLTYLSPELVLCATIVALFAGDLFVTQVESKRRYLTALALLGLGGSVAATAMLQGSAARELFTHQMVFDSYAVFFKYVFALVTAVVVLASMRSKELPGRNLGEYYGLLLAVTLGLNLMAAAQHLLMMYLSLELVSIVSYALTGYRLKDRKASEAALKYVIYGGVASGIMLFGISLLFGLAGSGGLQELAVFVRSHAAEVMNQQLSSGNAVVPVTLLVGVLMTFGGFGYKMAVAPFHKWCPDVYEGAPTPFTAFLSVGPKAAGFAMAFRFFWAVFLERSGGNLHASAIDLPWPQLLGIIAMVTMTLGNLSALGQTNVKRLLAYSSIAHAGYLLMGVVVSSEAGLRGVLLYLLLYAFMNLGAFLVVQVVRDRTGSENIADYKGLSVRAPGLAIMMAIFLFALTGLPPLSGFIGKFYLFYAVIERGAHEVGAAITYATSLYGPGGTLADSVLLGDAVGGAWKAGAFWFVLAIVGVLNSALSLFYYARIVRAMFLDKPVETKPLRLGWLYTGLLVALTVPTLVLGVYWSPAADLVENSRDMFGLPAAPTTLAEAPPDAAP